MSSARPPKLVLGTDYYMDGDKLVFTATYHRKRGFCCHSRCRHCPYGLSPADSAAPKIAIVGLPGEPSDGER